MPCPRRSHHPGREQVVEGERAYEPAVRVADQEASTEALVLEDLRSLGGELLGTDRGGIPLHHVADADALDGVAMLQKAPQVAVGEDAEKLARGVDHAGHADALPRNLFED